MSVQGLILDDLQDGYLELVQRILKDGTEVSPRGMRTREVLNASFTLRDPRRCVPVGVGRGVKYEIGAAESAHLTGGFSDAQQLVNAAKNFSMFVEHDRLYGAYGPRLYAQGANLIRTLHADPDTRQAGFVIWRPDELAFKTVDVPCTIELHFTIRNGALNLTTNMRSNDILWGVTFDVWMFASLQSALAYALGLPLGEYHHHAISLHAYVDRDAEKLAKLHQFTEDEEEHPPLPFESQRPQSVDLITKLRRWAHVRNTMEAAAGIREWRPTHGGHHGAKWYRDALIHTHSGRRICCVCRYVLPEKYFPRRQNDAHCNWCDRDLRHGLPVGTYARMVLAQRGKCAVCETVSDDLCLDHDHITGVARGLLCSRCNIGIGNLGDDAARVARASQYLSSEAADNGWMTDFEFLYKARPRESSTTRRS